MSPKKTPTRGRPRRKTEETRPSPEAIREAAPSEDAARREDAPGVIGRRQQQKKRNQDSGLRRALLPYDEVRSSDGAEKLSYLAVRAGVLNALITDDRVHKHFAQWAGWERDEPREVSARLIAKDVGHLVQGELKISWAFVTFELLDFYRRLCIAASGGPAIIWHYRVSGRAPNDLTLTPTSPLPRGEETALDAAERLTDLYRALMARLKAIHTAASSLKPGQRSPKNDGKHLETWGRWYYQRHIQHPSESLRSLTKTHHAAARHSRADAWDCCGSHVRKSIKEAERLLNLSRFRVPLRA